MTAASALKILWVDDEPAILDSFKRQLRSRFDLAVTTNPRIGLKLIGEGADFAIVVSDMRMPDMDGIEFLKEVKKISPDSVRLMLTGNSDQATAMLAINEGNIFRFLTKPCSSDELERALADAITQHRLISAEKELLQSTLSGSVKLLTDILSITDPASFGETMKLREPIRAVAKKMALPNAWEVELAAMLANIGRVTMPSAITAKMSSGYTPTAQEKELIDKIPSVGSMLIGNIPRLEQVAKIVLYQNKQFNGSGPPHDDVAGEAIPLGARIIKVIRDLSEIEATGATRAEAIQTIISRQGWYDQAVIDAVVDLYATVEEATPAPAQPIKGFQVSSDQLFIGQTLLSNLETTNGVLLVSAGTVITDTLLHRLRNYSKFVGIKEPILVDMLVPPNG